MRSSVLGRWREVASRVRRDSGSDERRVARCVGEQVELELVGSTVGSVMKSKATMPRILEICEMAQTIVQKHIVEVVKMLHSSTGGKHPRTYRGRNRGEAQIVL